MFLFYPKCISSHSAVTATVFITLFAAKLFGQNYLSNPGFEEQILHSRTFDLSSQNWTTHSLNAPYCYYDISRVSLPYSIGSYSLKINNNGREFKGLGQDSREFDGARQAIDASPLIGKRVKFSVYSRCIAGDETGYLGCIVLSKSTVLYKNQNRINPSNTKWKSYDLVFDVDSQSTNILLSISMNGKGTMLFDSASVSIVGDINNITTKNALVSFFNGQEQFTVLQSDIFSVSGSYDKGTVFLKNGTSRKYTYLPESSRRLLNK
jgi:hypothetical protein